MDTDFEYYPYSWHQSHDQVTVLLMVPYDTQEDEISVCLQATSLLVSIQDQPPAVKGKLHGKICVPTSVWQLEPCAKPLATRERVISTTSTLSTSGSSFALVSDYEATSSFAASLETSEVEDSTSPGLASPMSGASSDDQNAAVPRRISRHITQVSGSGSPRPPLTGASSFSSSLESLSRSSCGRLLTLHLEKDPSSAYIWPCLISGSAPEHSTTNVPGDGEVKYALDPTSLVLIAQDLQDIRNDEAGAFEYLIRAWRQARPPQATMRLSHSFLPPQSSQEDAGSMDYYVGCIGGEQGLAQLYLEAGMLHMEGVASAASLFATSGLASVRLAESHSNSHHATSWEWNKDQEAARLFFERAQALDPTIQPPTLPLAPISHLKMPELDIANPGGDLASHVSSSSPPTKNQVPIPRRRRKNELFYLKDDADDSWYLYVPGLIGAGTAILVVCALGLTSWRRSHN